MQNIQVLIFVSVMPVILMGMYINSRDLDKEPRSLLRKIFVFGILSIIPILVLETATGFFISTDKFSNYISLFINAFVSIGLIEEGAKWVIVNKSIYYDKEFNHPYDAIIYCVFASLGFAVIENIIYVFASGALLGVLRAVTAIPAHTCNGVIMGYFLGKAKKEEYNLNSNKTKKYMFYSLIVPIITHTVYDFVILMQNDYTLVSFIIFTCLLIIVSFIIVEKVSQEILNFDGTLYNSELSKLIEPNSYAFNYALVSVFVISVCLIITSGLILIL